jgi:type VI secretion system protein ImpL
LVSSTRTLLLRVPVSQRIYSRIRTNPEYNQKIDILNYFGESVRSTFKMDETASRHLQVPFMFTIEGYESIDLSPGSPVVANIVNERWVLSDDKQARVDFVEEDLDEISEQIKDHYLSEYAKTWGEVYGSLEIEEFKSLKQANDVLAGFTDPVYSPLLSVLQVGMTNTQLSSPALQNLADDHDQGKRGKATSYLADKFEGNKVDKRCRDINILLRESSKRPAPISAIIQQIQQLQEFVAEISVAPDPSKKAFDIAKARYQSGSGNAITALRAYAKNTPQPVRGWLNTLSDQTWKVVLRSARGHINAEWKEQVYKPYSQGLAGRYPLKRSSSDELALFDFSEFFKPAGRMDNFFQEYMKPFINTRKGWQNRGIDDDSIGFSRKTIKQVQKALEIKNVFFRKNPETPALSIELRPYSMDESDARFTLEIGGESV